MCFNRISPLSDSFQFRLPTCFPFDISAFSSKHRIYCRFISRPYTIEVWSVAFESRKHLGIQQRLGDGVS